LLRQQHEEASALPWCCLLPQAYIEQKLNPTLLKALTALARDKPTSQPQEAVVFLANWLLEHNPNKPRVAVPDELLQQQKRQLQEAQQAAAAAEKVAAAAAAKQQAMHESVSSNAGKLQVQQAVQDSGGTDDDSIQDAAATKVQAAFRGHRARKQVAGTRQSDEAAAAQAALAAAAAQAAAAKADAAVPEAAPLGAAEPTDAPVGAAEPTDEIPA
jgi:hypothetical protein